MFEDRGLGREPHFDEQSREYPVLRAGAEPLPIESRHWECPAVLDQGTEGACVGFSLVHSFLAHPLARRVVRKRREKLALLVYEAAKRIDEWPGEDYSGTSVLAGCKVLKRTGRIERYEWAFGLDEVLATLGTTGPVVLGINWYDSMYEPQDGRVLVGGRKVGGHAILANAVDFDRELVTLHNSWGPDWGNLGEAALSFVDLEGLLEDEGEAVSLS